MNPCLYYDPGQPAYSSFGIGRHVRIVGNGTPSNWFAAGVLLPGVGHSLGSGVSKSHTAGSERQVMHRESVLPVCASPLPCIPPPTGNGMCNAFPQVGKLESSSEHRPPQGEGMRWLSPRDRKPCPTLEKKKKKTDSLSLSQSKINIKITIHSQIFYFSPKHTIFTSYLPTYSPPFS